MDDAVTVGVFRRLKYTEGEFQGVIGPGDPLVAHQLEQRGAAPDVLHHDVGDRSAPGHVLARVVDGDDRRVAQQGGRDGLPAEPCPVIGVRRQFRPERLHGTGRARSRSRASHTSELGCPCGDEPVGLAYDATADAPPSGPACTWHSVRPSDPTSLGVLGQESAVAGMKCTGAVLRQVWQSAALRDGSPLGGTCRNRSTR